MSFRRFDSGIYDDCKFYLDNYRDTRKPTLPTEWILSHKASDLKWDRYDPTTFQWCWNYIYKHRRGGRNSRKRQSKKKGLRLRKVSRKY
jgi:hypothetical protein